MTILPYTKERFLEEKVDPKALLMQEVNNRVHQHAPVGKLPVEVYIGGWATNDCVQSVVADFTKVGWEVAVTEFMGSGGDRLLTLS